MDSSILGAIYGGILGLLGSAIGGWASYRGSKSAAKDSIDTQVTITERQKEDSIRNQLEELNNSAKTIYLDLFTAIFECLRFCSKTERPNIGRAPDCIPTNPDYKRDIIRINKEFEPAQLILINKLFGIIEKVKHDILNLQYITSSYDLIEWDYNMLGIELYGKQFFELLKENISELDDSDMIEKMNPNYREMFKRLRNLVV